MIKKITLMMVFTFLFATNLHSKAPPLGTGSLVPTNIMIMLDNSGSMAWDLGGNQLTSGSFLSNPTDINVDSQGNIYVWSSNNTYYEGKNYKLHVFNPDGALKKFDQSAKDNMKDMNNYSTVLYNNFKKLL